MMRENRGLVVALGEFDLMLFAEGDDSTGVWSPVNEVTERADFIEALVAESLVEFGKLVDTAVYVAEEC